MFLADFHVHSKYSRATARNLDLEHMYIAAQCKGVTVVGTGDFTHPAWFDEIVEKLVPEDGGLLRLRPDIAAACDRQVPRSCRAPVRFMLTAEISNIYKKAGKTRKNHNLVFADTLDTVRRLNRRLDRVGNIRSDGRPILGLDARDLLEIVLSVSEDAVLIPAHIWTPWFSLLGSKSGFDSIEACFEDLSGHIFALETGLSSDPPMNWRVSDLDGRTLVSNSDAHSPAKLGREANLFDCERSYPAICRALLTGDPERFLGTVEFYPEEGKYHFDGHRKCGVRLSPAETRRLGGRCPVCGRPLTLGVLYRVEELADRPAGSRPVHSPGFVGLVPLVDILSELLEVGPQSKAVLGAASRLIERFGSEFSILYRVDPSCFDASPVPLLAEAVRRMRSRDIMVEPGFDGEFGKVRLFSAQERRQLLGQKPLFSGGRSAPPENLSAVCGAAPAGGGPPPAGTGGGPESRHERERLDAASLNAAQKTAVTGTDPAILVVAGPGTGKTRSLTCRIADMILRRGLPPSRLLAVTFTHQAAEEMSRRLEQTTPEASHVTVCTFHRLCLTLLQEKKAAPFSLIDEDAARHLVGDAAAMARKDGFRIEGARSRIAGRISAAKQQLARPGAGPSPAFDDAALEAVFQRYQRLLRIQKLADYDDLIVETCREMNRDPEWRRALRRRFVHVLIDEYQDLNLGQYLLLRALVPHTGGGQTLFAIGDPDQSIYGFRGSDRRFFQRFSSDYPAARIIALSRNYRSTETILQASCQALRQSPAPGDAPRLYSGIRGGSPVEAISCRSEKEEAVAVGRLIESQVGGTGFHAVDFGRVDTALENERSFADFAVLARTTRQLDILEEVLCAAGIPVQTVRKDRRYAGRFEPLFSLARLADGHPTYQDMDLLLAGMPERIGAKTRFDFKRWAFANRLSGKQALQKAWRIPISEMSRTAQKRLCAAIRQATALADAIAGLSAAEALRRAAAALNIADAIEPDAEAARQFDRLIREAEQSGASMAGLLRRISLKTDADMFQPRAESVSLMTLHGAKGLEFPVVIIAGCEDGLIPMQVSPEAPADPFGEEMRLFYVGMTRAKERLYLTWSKTRRVFGRKEPRTISPFVRRIEARLIDARRAQEGRSAAKKQQQLELFE